MNVQFSRRICCSFIHSHGVIGRQRNVHTVISTLCPQRIFKHIFRTGSRRLQHSCQLSMVGARASHNRLDAARGMQIGTAIRPRTDRSFSVPYDDLLIREWRVSDRAPCVNLIGSILKEYGLDWDPAGADKDVVQVETAYRNGEFWVIEGIKTSKIVGTAAFFEVPHRGVGAVEIRKMYLSSDVRRKGLGSFLLTALEQRALQLGYTTAYIETASVLKEACMLYSHRNYVPSTGLETDRCDIVLDKKLQTFQTDTGAEHVEVIDMNRGWSVAPIARNQAIYHRILYKAVAVLVQSNSRIFVHKRSTKKSAYPGRMTVCITGCVEWMESPLVAAVREVEEEIGISGLTFSEAFAPFVSEGSDNLGQRIKFHPYIAKGDFSEEEAVYEPDEVEYGEFMSRAETLDKGIGGSLWQEFRANGF